jgi:hypothetical protein
MNDSRGTSITITYSMTVAVSSLLVMGLIFSAGGMLDQQQDRAIREQLQDLGTRVTSELLHTDRLVTTTTSSDRVRLRTNLPNAVAGSGYRVELVTSGTPTVSTVYLNSTSTSISVPVEIDTQTDVCPAIANGGQLIVAYNATQDCLTIDES